MWPGGRWGPSWSREEPCLEIGASLPVRGLVLGARVLRQPDPTACHAGAGRSRGLCLVERGVLLPAVRGH